MAGELGSAPADRMISMLAERFALPRDAGAQLQTLLRILLEDPLAPTSIDDPVRAVDDHLADSLVALDQPPVRSAAAIADLGAGAGLPGLPLAAALPASIVALVEASARKCEFIARAAATARIGNVEVVNQRAEAWRDGFGRFDLVTARALAPLDVVLEYAAPLLRVGGTVVAWRGRRDPDVEAAGARAAQILGLEVGRVVQVRPYAGAMHRHLHLVSKIMETRPEFPRRPGVAAKRPLGERAGPSDRGQR
jgi:16S rRNA (guanine527-N7)-methyltransferase